MPYYLFKIRSSDQIGLVKQLDLIEQYESFRDAKRQARQLRAEAADDTLVYKVMFAENRLSAEEQLLQKRARPVLMEHER